MLTEQEVSRIWGKLFKGEVTGESFGKAESLLDELRPESLLRHRHPFEFCDIDGVICYCKRPVGAPQKL